ncbi:hypothetical protein PCL_06599 [Purpureocillium lilacinum]|uniref:alpha-galactosidase n=1 Tax=Purpureocillium lilacinum TaxID=33203 RepID=A0A2U3EN52_PURLI|nr:hypothetical protein PCL_06599 [Purpureocillium lilacinum]
MSDAEHAAPAASEKRSGNENDGGDKTKDKRPGWPLWKKLAVAGAIFLVVVGLAVGLGVGLTRSRGGGDSDSSDDEKRDGGAPPPPSNGTGSSRSSVWRPKAGTSWQIVLRNPVDLGSGGGGSGVTPDVDVYDLDMYENSAATFQKLHGAGKKVVCYFSAGSYEDWRADKGEFKDVDLGKPLRGWAGERWLKLGSENVRRIMSKRVEYAAQKGCDAIDPDNVDGYQNDNGLGLTANDTISFVTFLQAEASRHNMSMGLKNAAGIIPEVLHLCDFSVNEQCVEEGECESFAAFVAAGKPVFHIEYPDGVDGENAAGGKILKAAAEEICGRKGKAKGAEGFSTVMKRMELDGWVEYCDGKVYETKTTKPRGKRSWR